MQFLKRYFEVRHFYSIKFVFWTHSIQTDMMKQAIKKKAQNEVLRESHSALNEILVFLMHKDERQKIFACINATRPLPYQVVFLLLNLHSHLTICPVLYMLYNIAVVYRVFAHRVKFPLLFFFFTFDCVLQ